MIAILSYCTKVQEIDERRETVETQAEAMSRKMMLSQLDADLLKEMSEETKDFLLTFQQNTQPASEASGEEVDRFHLLVKAISEQIKDGKQKIIFLQTFSLGYYGPLKF